jgi:ubiquinone/menaquinone biosynthesis C-methylase UbiE
MTVRPAIDYGVIAPRYDASRRAEPAIVSAFADQLRAVSARRVLEIGAGTGNYTRELAGLGFDVTALDLSDEMIRKGCAKVAARWIRADARALPIAAGAVDAAVGVNVLHHLGDQELVLRELRRVVRSGAVLQAVVRENLSTLWYRHYFPEIDEVLVPIHPSLGATVTAMLRAGFAHVHARRIFYSGSGDLTFEAARARPQLIFDEKFRAATSGFRRLGESAIARGLKRLRADMESGRFAQIAAPFDRQHRDAGDCFVITASTR